jgi:acyl carrier protein
MGLDAVEIVMSIEETFGLEIADADAESMRSTRDIIDYLERRLPTTPDEGCLTQKTFYRVRAGFRRAIPALASDFRLDTALKDMVHADQWPRVWLAIRESAREPGWPEKVSWPGPILRAGPSTVRELVTHIALQLPPPAMDRGEHWTRQGIEQKVRAIIIETTGIKEDFSLDAWLHRDLGID